MQTMVKRFSYLIVLACCLACTSENEPVTLPLTTSEENTISAVDISSFPEIELSSPTFYNRDGQPDGLLNILKNNGVNTIRLRLWVNPENQHSGFDEVKTFTQRLRSLGFDIWLTVHYSDTWADPGRQETPRQWRGTDFATLTTTMVAYTTRVMEELTPDYIQIGNEVNNGFLHPEGNLSENPIQFRELMTKAIGAVRETNTDTKIIVHFAGIEGADWFYEQVASLDYDIIGLSYYPIWHGKRIDDLKSDMNLLSQRFDKDILIAETAYPFTLAWNDQTHNIVGLEEQLILPEFPATAQGQQDFLNEIKRVVTEVDSAIGFCYWGGELVAWKGAEATDASPWENQALFDFDLRALQVLEVFDVSSIDP